MDNFLDEVTGFQTDRAQDVRKWVVGFMEDSCKKDPDLLSRIIANLHIMLGDEAVSVRKRVIQAMTFLYKLCLKWLCSAKTISDQMEAVWAAVSEMKADIVSLMESDNDGIRTHAIKFMEMLVIVQTHVESSDKSSSSSEKSAGNDFSLDDIPMTLKLLRRRKLEEEALTVFDELLKLHGSAHISSANLMTCMSSLTSIAKVRPGCFLPKVITALEMLHANLPPTLAKSQVSSVRKHLKNQLLALLRTSSPQNIEMFFTNITTLLTDLGASRDEVMKSVPNFDDMIRKTKAKKKSEALLVAASVASSTTSVSNSASVAGGAKRAKIDIPDVDESTDDSSSGEEEAASKTLQESAVDITEKFIQERLDPALVTELVMRSLPMLPFNIPPQFSNSYTPIAAAGTEGQVKHVSRLLAAQLTAVNLGPGVKEIRDKKSKMPIPSIPMPGDSDSDNESSKITQISVIGSKSEPKRKIAKKSATLLIPAGGNKKASGIRSRSLKLSEITKEFDPDTRSSLMLRATQRILGAEKAALNGGIPVVRTKIISALGARFSSTTKSALVAYIFGDFTKRIDLAFSWLFEEYCFYQGFHRNSALLNRRLDDSEYNAIYCTLIRGAIERTEGKEREHLLRRLYLESPIITEDAIELLKSFITIMGAAITVVNLMKDLVMRRPTKKLNCLNFLLEFCSHENSEVRQTAIATVLQLHDEGDFREIIEDYAVMYLKFLLNPTPPVMLFSKDRGRSQIFSIWMEDTVKVCLYLFLSLLPKNQQLLTFLAEVYTNAKVYIVSAASNGKPISVKHTILRELEGPISKIPMNSSGLLDLLDDPPIGSETLITRMVHILTDKSMPSPELVDKVKALYEDNRVQDVRFLIPVLTGLSKSEIIAILPKLIQLSPAVVKDVFHRLLKNNENQQLSPADLLIALHNLGNDPTYMKTVIQATKLCFVEKSIYTQEVLAIVLQKLMEEKTIPILLMRSVIQSLANYPKMIVFITNILQRLITKQVWKQKVIWDGFIKCCEKTMPQSYAVMLQLPPVQLTSFLEAAPHLREPLLVHVQGFTEAQRRQVAPSAVRVLYSLDEIEKLQQNENMTEEIKEERLKLEEQNLLPIVDEI